MGDGPMFFEGARVRGRFTNKPGTITKYNPTACAAHVHFDGEEREYPVPLHTTLHLVPFDKPSIYAEVADELARARRKFPGAQNSPHEGWAVLREEVDELWDDVKGNASRETMRKEAIQIAAMAIRFIEDLCDSLADPEVKP